jgi:hypothetical protein
VIVEQNPEAPVDAKILAEAIVKISQNTDAMLKAGLKMSTIAVLVSRTSRVSVTDVLSVLNSLATLRKDYTTL